MFDSASNFIFEKLNNSGFECYIVGGAVRDYLLGKVPSDYDFTTDATPKEIKQVFCDFQQIDSGEKHGTVGVIIDKKCYEITTYRIDGEYISNRKPRSVTLTKSLKEDLNRRDFTFNALCYHPKFGIIDYFNGKDDLNRGIIKAIGEPEKRFNEDALRILRAVRLEAKYGFTIEENTKIAMDKCKGLLKNISVERIYSELEKIVCGKFAKQSLSNNKSVIFEVIPELKACDNCDQKSLSHNLNVYDHILEVLDKCDPNDKVLRFTALFHDIGKPISFQVGNDGFRHFYNHWNVSADIALKTLTKLKAPKDMCQEVVSLCRLHDEDFATKYEIKKILRLYGVEFFKKLLEHKLADLNAHSPHGVEKYSKYYENTKFLFEEILKNSECYNLSMLDFNGSDALSLGLSGKKIGDIIEKVFDLVISDKLENNNITIIDYVKHNFT